MKKFLFSAFALTCTLGISPMATAGCYCQMGYLTGNVCLVPDAFSGRMAHMTPICTADAQPQITPSRPHDYPFDDYCEARPKGGKICQHNHRGTQYINHVAEYDAKGNVIYHRNYYSDGITVKSESHYDAKGRKQGVFKNYHSNGQLEGLGNFVNDQLEGEYRNFDKNGKLIRIEQYKDNTLISAKEYK